MTVSIGGIAQVAAMETGCMRSGSVICRQLEVFAKPDGIQDRDGGIELHRGGVGAFFRGKSFDQPARDPGNPRLRAEHLNDAFDQTRNVRLACQKSLR